VGTGDRRVPLILDVDTGIELSLAGERAQRR
jgi:hypothetical protein